MRLLRSLMVLVLLPTVAFCADIEKLKNTISVLTDANSSRGMGTFSHKKTQNWLEEQFKNAHLIPLGNIEHTSYGQNFKAWDKDGKNIIGGLGDFSSGRECIILGAHYDGAENDSCGCEVPAADDNASGIAGMLEIIRAMSEKKQNLNQCVIFAAWDFEETPAVGKLKKIGNYRTIGTNGSAYFVSNPTVPLDQIGFSITFDMIGGDFFKGAENLFMILGVESSRGIRPLLKKTKPALGPQMQGLNFDIRALEPLHNLLGSKDGHSMHRSDYDAFRDNGVPFIFISTGMPWYYHTAFDRDEFLNYPKMKAITEYTQSIIEELASGTSLQIGVPQKPIQDPQESSINLQILLSRLLEKSDENLMNAENDGLKIKQNLEDQLNELNDSIVKREFLEINKPYSAYHKILNNILTATRLRLSLERERISSEQKSQSK